jgi:hypothetical protein
MFANHLSYSLIKPNDRVLDLGGAAAPFRRANVVLDFCRYEDRNPNPAFLSNIPEHFTRDTWIQADLCDSSKPYPFRDGEFDFVNCGHLLEDVRDPFFILREIQRVAKRGYIEVPSRICEQLRWAERRRTCGFSHHRWFVDLARNPDSGKNELVFAFKNHNLHGEKQYQVRQPWWKAGKPRMNANHQYLSLYFNGPFRAYEDVRSAITQSHDFMLETVARAKGLGSGLWRAEEPVPARLEGWEDLPPGIHDLSAHRELVKERIRLFDSRTGKVHPDVARYEAEMGVPNRSA